MPMTKTITAASQYTPGIRVGHDRKLQYEIAESTPPLIATFSLQWILDDNGGTSPIDSDTRWTTIKEIDVGSDGAAGVYDGGKAWYRMAILADGYTSGSATIKLMQG